MGDVFRMYLEILVICDDMFKLLCVINVIVIFYDICLLFYWVVIGVIYLDVNNFWCIL